MNYTLDVWVAMDQSVFDTLQVVIDGEEQAIVEADLGPDSDMRGGTASRQIRLPWLALADREMQFELFDKRDRTLLASRAGGPAGWSCLDGDARPLGTVIEVAWTFVVVVNQGALLFAPSSHMCRFTDPALDVSGEF